MTARRLALVAATALALAALGAGARRAAAAGARSGDAPPPNLLLVTIDTLRKDRVGCYGNPSIDTPVLDRLAAQGTLFEVAVASSPTTAPSHATVMTARSPRAHGLLANGQILPPDVATLAESLRERGYATAAIVSSSVLGARTGLARGFDAYIEAFAVEAGRQVVSPAESTNARIVPWLLEHADGPFFLWVHYYDPHQPYEAPGVRGRLADPGYAGAMARWDSSRLREWNRAGAVPPSERTHLAACYDAEVAYADAQLGALLDALDAAGARARTLVCVTSDHGETLGEHDAYFGHAHHLFDATLLVPLVVSLPGRVARDARVTEPVRLLDLAPTLLEILGAGALREVEGRSFAPLAWARSAPRGGRAERDSGPVVARRAIAVAETRASDRADAELNPVPHKLAIRTAGGKLVRWLDSDSLEVYDLATDPAESRNVAAGDTALARSLASALSAWEDETGAAPPLEEIDEETRERLRSLGYIE